MEYFCRQLKKAKDCPKEQGAISVESVISPYRGHILQQMHRTTLASMVGMDEGAIPNNVLRYGEEGASQVLACWNALH